MKTIYHHLGLGDHIICNGLVRAVMGSGDYLLCKQHNLESVRFMFSDVNLEVIGVADDQAAKVFAKANNGYYIGYLHEDWNPNIGTFDKTFYEQAGVPFVERWNNYRVRRDPDAEMAVRAAINPPFRYAFVHMDAARGMTFVPETNLPCVGPAPGLTRNIFDYQAVIRGAEEVHCLESAFMHMIDSMRETTFNSLHAYRSARPATRFDIPATMKNWTIHL